MCLLCGQTGTKRARRICAGTCVCEVRLCHDTQHRAGSARAAMNKLLVERNRSAYTCERLREKKKHSSSKLCRKEAPGACVYACRCRIRRQKCFFLFGGVLATSQPDDDDDNV